MPRAASHGIASGTVRAADRGPAIAGGPAPHVIIRRGRWPRGWCCSVCGGGGRCLSGGGRGGGGGGEVVQGGGSPPPPARMNHIDQELQKCTTLTHSVYTFVIMSEHR